MLGLNYLSCYCCGLKKQEVSSPELLCNSCRQEGPINVISKFRNELFEALFSPNERIGKHIFISNSKLVEWVNREKQSRRTCELSIVADRDKFFKQIRDINKILTSSQTCEFSILWAEIKRLKTQDLTIQIPLRKQELEQLIKTIKEKLTKAEKYPLEKLLEKHFKTLQNSDNSNLEELNELKEVLSEKLTQGEIQNLLDKQTEIFNLEKHSISLLTEQMAQIQIPPQ